MCFESIKRWFTKKKDENQPNNEKINSKELERRLDSEFRDFTQTIKLFKEQK